MAYSDFRLNTVIKKFELVPHSRPFTQPLQPLAPSEWLLQTLEIGSKRALYSEKSRSELIVSPILSEIERYFSDKISVYSGANLEAELNLGLSGECDFLLSLGEQMPVFVAPVFCLIEAKDQDMKLGMGQCIAQMIGARLFNQNAGKDLPVIFGCATTAVEWQFLRLENDEIIFDSRRFSIDNLNELLGALYGIVNTAIQTA